MKTFIALHRLVTWSVDHGFLINKTKCAECLFYPKNTTLQLPLSLINGDALSREQTVKYLGVHFNSNLTWSTYIDSVFTKCLKISFFYPKAPFNERPQIPLMANCFRLCYLYYFILLTNHFPWTA